MTPEQKAKKREYYRQWHAADPERQREDSRRYYRTHREKASANHKDPQLMPDAFLRAEEVFYKVTVPNRGHEIELAAGHPWMRQGGAADLSWEISFTGASVPTAVEPSGKTVNFPVVSWVKPFAGSHAWNTRSIPGGCGNTATLSTAGRRFIQLVAGDF